MVEIAILVVLCIVFIRPLIGFAMILIWAAIYLAIFAFIGSIIYSLFFI